MKNKGKECPDFLKPPKLFLNVYFNEEANTNKILNNSLDCKFELSIRE